MLLPQTGGSMLPISLSNSGSLLPSPGQWQTIGVNSTLSAGIQTAINGGNFVHTLTTSLVTNAAGAIEANGAGMIGGLFHTNQIGETAHLVLHGIAGCASGATFPNDRAL